MSDPIAAVRIAYDRDHDVGEAALRGMRIELAAWLTDEIYACNALLHEGQVRGSGYLRSWRWRVGCRLLTQLERVWPPDLADERDLKQFVHRVTRFLERTAQEPSRAARAARATTSD